MRPVLYSEIVKEKCNAKALGAYTASLGASDNSSVVKREVAALYKEQRGIENEFKSRKIGASEFDERTSAIGRKINAIESKNGVFFKDLFVKSIGK